MTYALNFILSITTSQSVLLWLLLSKTKIFPLGNIVMLLLLIRNVADYCGRSVLLWCRDLGTKKFNILQSLDFSDLRLLSVLIECVRLYFDSLG